MRWYNIALHKAYFYQGWGVTSMVKYAIALFGLYSIGEDIPMKYMVWIGIGYALFSYILGWLMYEYGFIQAEIEVNNRYNEFVKEVRAELKNGKVFKG